jgi:ATP-binding cassette subfamily F protein uup
MISGSRPLLVSLDGVARQFGVRPLFSGLSFALAEGDRVGLVGPNGAGKSTLLRILAGLEEADAGTRSVRRGVRVALVPQDPRFEHDSSAAEAVHEALAADPVDVAQKAGRVARALGRLGFRDGAERVGTLSGGWQKRLAIAAALAREPDVLLMDEPTNHLDLEGILALEALLVSSPFAFVVASHDRYFLENVARRMLELDPVYPEGLLAVAGRYSDLVARRDEVRRNQAEYEESLANRARRELEWLRRGPKARTTKAKARVGEAERLQAELAEVRARQAAGAAGIELAASGRRTKRLLEARGLAKSYGGRRVLAGVDVALAPGTRLGVLGSNGSGKTTLLSILAGTVAPDAGEIERAPALETVLFEQSRATLDRSLSLRRALAPEADAVIYQGRELHVAAWAKRFLFRTEQLDTPVARLSGGEQARILIARLMLRPADLLILDEPTNDLDIPTLEVLEESLLEFAGALVLVTHDRYLLDRVSTALLALDGRGGATLFADLAQWEASRKEREATDRPEPGAATPAAPRRAAKKLGYAEQREWESMEAAILAAEAEAARCHAAAEDPAIVTDAEALHRRTGALAEALAEVERLYARWAELESKRG